MTSVLRFRSRTFLAAIAVVLATHHPGATSPQVMISPVDSDASLREAISNASAHDVIVFRDDITLLGDLPAVQKSVIIEATITSWTARTSIAACSSGVGARHGDASAVAVTIRT
jgi:hypothetical protein